MDRKTFIKNGCIACLGIAAGASVLQSCAGTKYAASSLADNGILLPLSEFETKHHTPRPYVVVQQDELQYPICVYRIDAAKYTALLMSCSHQGAELQASGDQLTCPAHGSEFDKYGNATQLPATAPLRTFPVSVINDQLFIDLRANAKQIG